MAWTSVRCRYADSGGQSLLPALSFSLLLRIAPIRFLARRQASTCSTSLVLPLGQQTATRISHLYPLRYHQLLLWTRTQRECISNKPRSLSVAYSRESFVAQVTGYTDGHTARQYVSVQQPLPILRSPLQRTPVLWLLRASPLSLRNRSRCSMVTDCCLCFVFTSTLCTTLHKNCSYRYFAFLRLMRRWGVRFLSCLVRLLSQRIKGDSSTMSTRYTGIVPPSTVSR